MLWNFSAGITKGISEGTWEISKKNVFQEQFTQDLPKYSLEKFWKDSWEDFLKEFFDEFSKGVYATEQYIEYFLN